MTDGHPPPSTPAADENSGPFTPFVLEPVKAFRRLVTQPAFMGLLVALLVAVPTVVATLPGGGDPASDKAVVEPTPPTDQVPDDNSIGLQAYEDCVRSPWLRANCEAAALKSGGSAAALYLECRNASLTAERCLAKLP